MVRYGPLSIATLSAQVAAVQPGWLAKAATRTAANVAAGALVESDGIWSEIKSIFMRIQHNKCLYCERPLAGEQDGRVEQDVEHFRPKGRISAWPKANSGLTYAFATGAESASGYFWLAYDLQNYAAACKPCNSTRKSDAFPIFGARGVSGSSVAALNRVEKPALIFPFGTWGDDPEPLLTFDGIVILPRAKSGKKHNRARVTIDFFALNDREELWEDRFRAIREVFANVQMRETSPNPAFQQAAIRALEEAISEAAPQALCARAFLKLMSTDAAKAWATYQVAEQFVTARRRGR
jgi:hypothetical protein